MSQVAGGDPSYWKQREAGLAQDANLGYDIPTRERRAWHGCFEGGDPAALAESAKRMAALAGVRTICPGHDAIITEEGWLGEFAANVEAAVAGEVSGQPSSGFIAGQEVRFDTLSVWLPM